MCPLLLLPLYLLVSLVEIFLLGFFDKIEGPCITFDNWYDVKKYLNWISNLHKNSIHKKYCMSFSICNRHCLRYILKSCHIKKHFVSCSLCMHEFQLNLHVCLVFRSFVHSYFLCKCFQDIEYHDILYVRSIFGALIK